MYRVEARRSRANGTITYGYQPDENNDVESNENQKVDACINGEEIQDESEGKEVFI